jgi:Mrp family chromosome partitioning ATPase
MELLKNSVFDSKEYYHSIDEFKKRMDLMDKRSKHIIFTSCSIGEGTTSVVINYAYILSKQGRKVLIVNAGEKSISDTDIPNVSISGIQGASDKGVLEDYEYILYDMEPLESNLDAAVYAKERGGIVLVVEENTTTITKLLETTNKLKKIDVLIYGTILNRSCKNKRVLKNRK